MSTTHSNHSRIRLALLVLVGLCLAAATASAQTTPSPLSPTNIFAPVSTPAHAIHELSLFLLGVTAFIFVVVFSLLAYAVVRFRSRTDDDNHEPPQVYGSTQVELAWTVIPVLIVVALLMASARVIATIQKAERPANAIEVVAIGHQFWWEYRYPGLNVVTANELHVPISDPANPAPTFITLLSADMRLIARVGSWLDARLQLGKPIRETAEHEVPRDSASWFYVF